MALQSQKEKSATEKRHWIRLTKTCNNQCIFCLDSENQNGTFLSLKEIKNNLLKGREEKIKRVILSGGEPTIHPDFLSIVKMAKKLGYTHIQIITNGRMFAYQDFLEKAIRNGVREITFSIHGHNSKLHDQQTQVKGSFNQSLKGLINALKIPGLIVNVDVVINKINYKYLVNILKFFINLGVTEFDLLQVIPFGQAWDNRQKVFYNIKEALPHLKKAFHLNKNPNLYLWTNRFPASYLEGFEDLIQHPQKLFAEIKGREEDFEKVFKKNIFLNCYGQRCEYCFLKDFCQDLIKFQKKGYLESKNYPPCLNKPKRKIKLKKEKKLDIFKLLNFYIEHRYFVKSLRCKKCKFDKNCQGMQVDYIREHSFKSLTPIK